MIEVFLFFFNCSGPYIAENERVVVKEVSMHQTKSDSSTVDVIFMCLYPSESSLDQKLMRDKLLLIRALTL